MPTTANRPATTTSKPVAVTRGHDRPVGQKEARGPAGQRSPSFGEKLSRRLWPLDFNKLRAQAVRRTGVQDFDSPALAPALPILLDSLDQEAGLHPLGRFLMRTHLRDLLETRLRLAGVWKSKAAEMEAQRLEQPVFIVGIPRS